MAANPMTAQRIVLQTDGMGAVTVRETRYPTRGGAVLALTTYAPPDLTTPAPAVVLATGYPDPGFAGLMGCRQAEMASYVSWAELLASHGMVAVTYENADPLPDALAVFRHLRADAASLGIDPDRLALWACSGNVPTALAVLGAEPAIRCAALCYGYMLDDPAAGETPVADAAAQFRFANPGAAAETLPRSTPMLVVRADADEMPGLNASIHTFMDRMAGTAVRLRTVPDAPHAFDLNDDSDSSRAAIGEIVAFLRDTV